jgi:hypothetical protein
VVTAYQWRQDIWERRVVIPHTLNIRPGEAPLSLNSVNYEQNKVPITEHMDYEVVCSSIKILYQCIPVLENKYN